MSYCFFLKTIRPEWRTGVPSFLLFRGLCFWHLWSVSPSFPWLCFQQCILSNRSRCSHIKATRPERLPDKVQVRPDLSPPPSFSDRKGENYLEWPVSYISGSYFVCSLFLRFGGGQPLHNVPSLVFRNPLEIPATSFTISSPKICLTVLLNALLLPRCSCCFMP
jgi:hypothetical protein